jgi:SOS response regulatory protein OraA/RecX
MVAKEAIEKYVEAGIRRGHSISSLKKALAAQGIKAKEIRPVLRQFREKQKEQKRQKKLEELNASVKTKSVFGKAKLHVLRHPYFYSISISVMYVFLLWLQALLYWASKTIMI